MPTMLPDVAAPIQALRVWLSRPETAARMQAAVSDAIAQVEQHILSDTSLRVPRRREEREYRFRSWLDAYDAKDLRPWLDTYKRQLAQQIQNEVLAAFPSEFARVRNKDLISDIVGTSIWPQVEPQLRQRAEDLLLTYAVRGIALTWVTRNISDGLLLGLPEAREDGWRIPLHDHLGRTREAELVVNQNGDVLTDVEGLRVQLQAGT